MKIADRGGRLTITDFNEIEAYKIARKIERDGVNFYRKFSESVKDASTKETLEFLIKEEDRHIRTFEALLFGLIDTREDTTEEEDLLEGIDYGIFRPYNDSKELESLLSEPSRAIKLAVILEGRSIDFYESCKQAVSSPQTKKEIAKIIEEEKRHKRLFEEILSKVKDNG